MKRSKLKSLIKEEIKSLLSIDPETKEVRTPSGARFGMRGVESSAVYDMAEKINDMEPSITKKALIDNIRAATSDPLQMMSVSRQLGDQFFGWMPDNFKMLLGLIKR